TAWQWGPHQLVVPLGADKALLLERQGDGPELAEVARHFDLGRLAKALDGPPRTDFRRTPEAFRVLAKGVPYAEVVAWVGWADEDIGGDTHVMVYRLPDGARALLGFADFGSLLHAQIEHSDGRVEDLVR